MSGIPWNHGMNLLKGENDLSRRKHIVKGMKEHPEFKRDIERFRLKAENRRKKR